jgi:hypothetical protein
MNFLTDDLSGLNIGRIEVGDNQLENDFQINWWGVEVRQVQDDVHVIFRLANKVK